MKKTLFILFTLILTVSCSSQNKSSSIISGYIDGGLRYIDIESEDMDSLKIYRGDYIVFKNLNDNSITFRIDELGINESLPKPDGDKPYIKMKQSGTYLYSLGDIDGSINIVEFTENNYTELSAEQGSELIKNITPFILDVRTSGEYNSGHIPNAALLPVQILSENLSKLESYKYEPIFVYCQSGNRSTVASKILIDAGFTKVYNLRNGVGDWKNRGYSTVR